MTTRVYQIFCQAASPKSHTCKMRARRPTRCESHASSDHKGSFHVFTNLTFLSLRRVRPNRL